MASRFIYHHFLLCQWRKRHDHENALFDYAIFATNAQAVLDMEERAFLVEVGAKLIGPSRLALALANRGFLSSGDYRQVLALAEKFLQRTLGGGIPGDSDDELRTFYEKEILPGLGRHHESGLIKSPGSLP